MSLTPGLQSVRPSHAIGWTGWGAGLSSLKAQGSGMLDFNDIAQRPAVACFPRRPKTFLLPLKYVFCGGIFHSELMGQLTDVRDFFTLAQILELDGDL